MQYKYIPNSYNNNLIDKKFRCYEQFLNCQIIYKMEFEKILSKYLNINGVENYINSQNVIIPKVKDVDYNFYHRYSKLGSDYLFVRNNYHVENLDDNEINCLLFDKNLGVEFFNKTLYKVIFENGDSTFYGIACDENRANSKSIVFEFAYNQIECTTLKQQNQISEIIEECFKMLQDNINKLLKINSSYLVYNSIPNLFNDLGAED